MYNIYLYIYIIYLLCICYMYYATKQKDAVSTPPMTKDNTHTSKLSSNCSRIKAINSSKSTFPPPLSWSWSVRNRFSKVNQGWCECSIGQKPSQFVSRSIYNVEDSVQLPLCFFNVRSLSKSIESSATHTIYLPGSKLIPPIIGSPHSGYLHPSNWDDDHPPLYGNHGSLDPSIKI